MLKKIRANLVLNRLAEFLNRWQATNTKRQEENKGDLVLKDGTTRQNLEERGAELSAKTLQINTLQQQRVIINAQRDGERARCRKVMDSWRKAALYKLDNTAFVANLPTLPPLLAPDKDVLDVFDAVLARWEQMNNASNVPHYTPPLLTRENLTRTQFAAMVETYRAECSAIGRLDDQLNILRRERDDKAREVRAICKQFRLAMAAEYDADNVLMRSLPTLNPPRAGKNPTPVKVEATFEPSEGTARVTWTPSKAPDLANYSLRICVGSRYLDADETQIAEIPKDKQEFIVSADYLPPDATVWAKIYVVTTKDREKGSKSVLLRE